MPLTSLLVSGCARSGFQWEGEWEGKLDIQPRPGEDAAILNTLAKVSLKIEPGGRFGLFQGGVPFEGEFREWNGQGFLKIDRYMDRPLPTEGPLSRLGDREIELKPNKDGTLRFHDPAAFDKTTVTLHRKTKPAQ